MIFYLIFDCHFNSTYIYNLLFFIFLINLFKSVFVGVSSLYSTSNALNIFSSSSVTPVNKHTPFLSILHWYCCNVSFIFSAVIPCSQPSTFNVDLLSNFNILYCIILIIVNAIKHIKKCAFICSSFLTYIGLPSK